MMIWPPGAAHYYGNKRSSYRHSWIHCDGQTVTEILIKSKLPALRPFAVDQPTLFPQGLSELLAELATYTGPIPRSPVGCWNYASSVLRNREPNGG
ncbi:hypothetical protein BH09VER1_BH09VER1_17700 [soil metagenome]